ADDDLPAGGDQVAVGGLGVVESGRVGVLLRQAIVERYDFDFGVTAELGADVVVAFQPPDDEAAAMQIEQCRVALLSGDPVSTQLERPLWQFGGQALVSNGDGCRPRFSER